MLSRINPDSAQADQNNADFQLSQLQVADAAGLAAFDAWVQFTRLKISNAIKVQQR